MVHQHDSGPGFALDALTGRHNARHILHTVFVDAGRTVGEGVKDNQAGPDHHRVEDQVFDLLVVEEIDRLVGLQEVYNLTINGENSLPPFRDYLNDLLDALDDQGANYYVAATVKNLDLNLTFGMMAVSVIDRDVILAREDVETEVVDGLVLSFMPAIC